MVLVGHLYFGGFTWSCISHSQAWKQLGFTMPKVLAWFITFNFINIAWVFFRAKEWDDAIKVLHGMFFGQIILPSPLENKLNFLNNYGIEFGKWLSGIKGDREIFIWLIVAFVTTLFFKNSMQLRESFKTNFIYMFSTIVFFLSIFVLYRKSEFIYFNF